ncbi:hypothetical protein BDW72DRAFT_206733 [Aspergillus terricola var. indicus]
MSKIDPIQKLNFDCASLILQHLNIYELARCQLVSRQWRQTALEWIATTGLRWHFPRACKRFMSKFSATAPQAYQVWEEFQECAYEKARKDVWLSGRAFSSMECHKFTHFARSDKFIAWHHEGSIYWRWAGYQEHPDRPPYLMHKLNYKLPPGQLRYMAVCSEAQTVFLIIRCPGHLAKLRKMLPNSTRLKALHDEPEHLDIMVDIHTGQELWSAPRRYARTDWERWREALKLGWKKIYRYGSTKRELDVHDIRTGKKLYSLPFASDVPFPALKDVRVVRLGGREIIMTLNEHADDPQHDCEIRFIDGEYGRLLQAIKAQTCGGFSHIVPSERRNELAFALITYGVKNRPYVALIRKYGFDANQKLFVPQGLALFDLEKLRGAYEFYPVIDPFRNFIVGVQKDTRFAVVLPIVRLRLPWTWHDPKTGRPYEVTLGAGTGRIISIPHINMYRIPKGYEPDGPVQIQGSCLLIGMPPDQVNNDRPAFRFFEFGFRKHYNRTTSPDDTLFEQDHSY